MQYDLAVIGGGPAGYVAGARAGAGGLKVVLFEKRELGGVCLNEGCIPTKTLLYSAKLLDGARGAEKYGIEIPETKATVPAIFKRKEKVVKKLVAGVRAQMRNAAVEVVSAAATLLSKRADAFVLEADGLQYEARNVLVCTGSEAVVPPIPGLREALSDGRAVTSREILSLPEVPERLVVMGGGVIGMELASLYHSLGSQVTVVEMLPKILGPMDAELSALLQAQYEKKGVQFCLGCKVVAVEGCEVVFEDAAGISRVEGDRILVSVGRRASLEGLGLENLGVELSARPYGIKVDAQMRSSVPGLYAAGDVTGFSMLAHTASREAEVAVNNILGKADTMRYDAIPGVVYTNPEVAGVGLTEQEAAEKGIAVQVNRLPMAFSGRFVAENERGEGLCKVLVEESAGAVVGVHLLGNPASEIIGAACVAVQQHLDVEALKKVVLPHPSVTEILKEAII